MKTIVERLEDRDIEAWSDPYSCRARGMEAAACIRELEAERDALMAEAYEAAAEAAFDCVFDGMCKMQGTRVSAVESVCSNVVADIRALTPADAIATRDARDKQVREDALREAAEIAKRYDEASGCMDCNDTANIVREILALIEKDKTNE